MRILVQLCYSFREKGSEIPQADVDFLKENNPWNAADDTLIKAAIEAGSYSTAIAMTAMHLRKLLSWITIGSFRHNKTAFELTMDEKKADEFERLVTSGELVRKLNEKFKKVTEEPLHSQNKKSRTKLDFSHLAGVVITSLTRYYGEPVAIVLQPDGDDSNPVLDHDALAQILLHTNVGNRPIALISIAGAFRKGKSFILNFFLRYLKNRGHQYPENWIGDRKKSLDDGFSWKGGVDRNTKGIMMWNEPFIVERLEEEIAVFLLDTQGNFDLESGYDLSTKVFVLSLLLSSVFIFNIHHQVQENDLDYLQFATEYSRVAKDDGDDEDGFSPFQSLLFLVRDWCELEDFDYGLEGGHLYLEQKVLLKKSKNTSSSCVRRYLRESFKDIRCYLMPEPGKKVGIRRPGQTFTGSVGDIDPEFVEHVKNLANILLKPENLIIKHRMTDGSLLGFITCCCNAIKNDPEGKLPNPRMLMEAAAEAMSADVRDKSLEKYKESMTDLESNGQTSLTWNDFDEKEMEIRTNIKNLFCKNLKFGDKSFKKRQKEKLASQLESAKKDFVKRYESKKIKERSDIKELAASLLKKHKDAFFEVFDNDKSFNDESNLEKTHSELFGNIMRTFKSKTSKYSPDVKLPEEEVFEANIKDHYLSMKLQYSKKMERMQRIIDDDMFKTYLGYRKAMKEELNSGYVKPNVLNKMHRWWTEMIKSKKIPGITDEANKEHMQNVLEKLNEEFQIFTKRNKENKSIVSPSQKKNSEARKTLKKAGESFVVGGTIVGGTVFAVGAVAAPFVGIGALAVAAPVASIITVTSIVVGGIYYGIGWVSR